MKKNDRIIMHFAVVCGGLSVVLFLFLSTLELAQRRYLTAGAGYAAAILLLVCFVVAERTRIRNARQYMEILSEQSSHASTDVLCSLPLPAVILQIDGRILWFNSLFVQTVNRKSLFDVPIQELFTDLKWQEVLKATDRVALEVYYNERHYHIDGKILQSQREDETFYTVILYFIDMTQEETLRQQYTDEQTDVAIISIDNYDEILQKAEDAERQRMVAQIDRYISEWVAESGGLVKKTERDRYLMLFEHQYLKMYIDKKFDVLDRVRSLSEGTMLPVTISIGIGVGGHILQNENHARSAIDLVYGRGGDQAAIKDETQYKFYGGKTKEYEKSTRVKTRAFSFALKEFIQNADRILLMGHKSADYDSLGAAIGLQRAARSLGKKPYIIMDESPAVANLINRIYEKDEYDGMIIDTAAALDIVTENTLLIVLDTHRPSMLPCPQLLDRASKVILIDHHRRSTEFIENCSLVYHEPYASSTCEMVTEILQYLDSQRKMTTFEAEALYVGLVMDTKNFVVKTGARTFEAASALRRYGVDTTAVRQLFKVDATDYNNRAAIVEQMKVFTDRIGIAVWTQHIPNVKVVASKAADDMLTIANIEAGFVIYAMDNVIGVSGRSLGKINVQVILEKIGGGGHMTVAGAQLRGKTAEEVKELLENAIREYIEEK